MFFSRVEEQEQYHQTIRNLVADCRFAFFGHGACSQKSQVKRD